MVLSKHLLGWSLLFIAFSIVLFVLFKLAMLASTYVPLALGFSVLQVQSQLSTNSTVGIKWYPPNRTEIDDLATAVNGTGVYGFVFNSSYTEAGNSYYGGYNWCNMPHVNVDTYLRPSADFELEYVEVVRIYSHREGENFTELAADT